MRNQTIIQNRVLFIIIVFLTIYFLQESQYAHSRGILYWIETDIDTLDSNIMRAQLNGSTPEEVLTGLHAASEITLDLHNSKMYWIENFAAKIQRANIDGSNIENIVTGYNLPPGGGRLSMKCFNGKCEGIATPNGGNPINIPHEKLIDPNCIAIDHNTNKIYWANGHLKNFQRSKFDGSDIEDIYIKELILPANIKFNQWLHPINIELDADAGKIYWTDIYANKIQRANLDGSEPEDLITDIRSPYALALDLHDRKMYWSNTVTGKIHRASLNGNNVETLVRGLSFPSDIALDLRARKIYWIDTDSNTDIGIIQRANLDGTNIRNIYTGINYLAGLTLDNDGTLDVSPELNQVTTTWGNIKSQ